MGFGGARSAKSETKVFLQKVCASEKVAFAGLEGRRKKRNDFIGKRKKCKTENEKAQKVQS